MAKERPIDWDGNIYKIINNYTKVHRKFFKKVCQPKVEPMYMKLLREYRGQGYYLPKLGDNIDRQAIISNLHHFSKKIRFIDKQIERLKKTKKLIKFELLHNELNEIVESLLDLKKQNHLAISEDRKKRILNESRSALKRLKKQFEIYTDQIHFLKSYGFPNDFLEYRKKYEKYKHLEGKANKKIANKTYFFRKIVEDGALDPNKTRPDKYIRTTLDTLYLNIQKEEDFLSENVRYDLEWIERNIERIMDRGKRVILSRLEEWKERTEKNFKFYQELVQLKNKDKAKKLVKKENEATHRLKEFVYKKQAEVYEFWTKQSTLNKALFALETILVHEVGVIDGEHGLERQSVTQVVLNRYHDDFYNQLEPDQPIVKYISDDIDIEDEHWLNVLFKIGEFSFTYHYIPAVAGIYCPDMSRRGRSIRKKNLKIALKAIKNYDTSFNAFRYFSRVSMLGKIDMSTVWTGYERLPEMVGYKATKQRKLISYYLADKYQYLYTFKSRRGITYTVLKIDGTTYSMRWEKGSPVFYDYRNPHYFTYFSKKN
jgi:hypothetical protein